MPLMKRVNVDLPLLMDRLSARDFWFLPLVLLLPSSYSLVSQVMKDIQFSKIQTRTSPSLLTAVCKHSFGPLNSIADHMCRSYVPLHT
ncbi:hypothetical protein EV421DRAFT_234767 [Armillaria borealis]|uniref:Uncharacterized protein n=1 Tax=Armillaria borealis TaxID=47425 RepID=A0AA39IW59_9AGAR|nr:hypothetical protein EV421DRAFT_234767 [Armillaria borealis]